MTLKEKILIWFKPKAKAKNDSKVEKEIINDELLLDCKGVTEDTLYELSNNKGE